LSPEGEIPTSEHDVHVLVGLPLRGIAPHARSKAILRGYSFAVLRAAVKAIRNHNRVEKHTVVQKRCCLYCRPVLLKHSALCGGFSPAQKTRLSATALKNTPLLRPPWLTLHPCSESQPQRIPAPPSLANAPQSPLVLSLPKGRSAEGPQP